MLKSIIAATAFLFITVEVHANIPVAIVKSFRRIVQLINQDKAAELSQLVKYPLTRQNSLPDISTGKQFISYYPVLFDSYFKKQIKSYDDSVIFEHNGSYGLVGGSFNGEIWVDETGKITAINYSSQAEIKRQNEAIKNSRKKVHASVSDWNENVLVAKSKNVLIRIDRTDKGLRYVSWSKGHSMLEKPDLMLLNGLEELQGTMGGRTWTFVNGQWTYTIDDVQMCDTPKNCGLFLKLGSKGVVKSSIRLTEIK